MDSLKQQQLIMQANLKINLKYFIIWRKLICRRLNYSLIDQQQLNKLVLIIFRSSRSIHQFRIKYTNWMIQQWSIVNLNKQMVFYWFVRIETLFTNIDTKLVYTFEARQGIPEKPNRNSQIWIAYQFIINQYSTLNQKQHFQFKSAQEQVIQHLIQQFCQPFIQNQFHQIKFILRQEIITIF
ncbi:unnamed protein product [Paramecium sonneborni]|uniref:Uncharacterized protein n=1 Tax=Paramecium sonneborni TaxID=65129 RepID=A0A8S1QR83_9CILI|nr:unnamed protein product [Paramecium sonneborni]